MPTPLLRNRFTARAVSSSLKMNLIKSFSVGQGQLNSLSGEKEPLDAPSHNICNHRWSCDCRRERAASMFHGQNDWGGMASVPD
jgi:hypothetical protein